MTHADLFSGIGGFSIAAHAAGYRTILHCESADYPRRVLGKRFPAIPIYPDEISHRVHPAQRDQTAQHRHLAREYQSRRTVVGQDAVRLLRENVQDRLGSDIRLAEARLAALRAAERAHRPAVDDPDLAIVAEYAASGRPYLRKDEREALRRLLGVEEPSNE